MLLEDSILIDCPPASVYQLISDVERHAELCPVYLESKIVEYKNDTFVLQREGIIHGRHRRWKSEVFMEDGRAIHFRQLEGPLVGMRVDWIIEPAAEKKTELRIIHDIHVRPWWRKWFMERVVAKPSIEPTVKRVLESFKQAAEMRFSV
jgi:ribosome-associated toxin RatA of RatAB toxin-antitoxin module